MSPDAALTGGSADGELVLEDFWDSLELRVVSGPGDPGDAMVCVSGAVSPLPGDQHPALSRRGLDFVALRDRDPGHIVLGVVQSTKDETPFLLLLRALNALAELTPPLRIVQLGREILRSGIPEDARIGMALGLTGPVASPLDTALGELTRDLAEAFLRQARSCPQLSGILGEISCMVVDPESLSARRLARRWRVSV